MIVAVGLGDLSQQRRVLPNGRRGERMIEARLAYRQEAARRAAAEVTRRAALTPEQRAAEDKIKAEQIKVATFRRDILTELHAGKRMRHDLLANKITSPAGRALQAATLARDWDALFALTGPPKNWKPKPGGGIPSLAKYSFQENGVRRYVAFTKDDVRRFIFSKHYQVEPGHVCTDAQRELGLNAHWEKTNILKRRYPDTVWNHMWFGLYPGWGYPGQRWMCERPTQSRWVRMRKKVYAAVGIAAAVFLGPIVISKVGGLLAHGSGGGAIVGAGTKVGAVAAKAGITKAAVVAKVGLAAKTAGYLATVQTGVGYLNTGRTVNAIIHGDAPPPPINVTGKNFTDWALNIAKDELARSQEKKLTALEEERARKEIEAIQREIDAFVPRGTPIMPDPNLQPGVRDRIATIQNIEQKRTDTGAIALALAIPVGLLLMAA